ncbi:unnamed protein product [Heligmosomoides polygyrus]|uniref:Endonuclease-reverse transcriptase n=1 Tax=Heligmosomoides polygyrus TaxID=6339 RepID=A0A183FTX7_HELPZ|nr:unnamed protein product [Heligmosomoides polygyrus]
METKMLRWTAGVTRMDRIRNDAIRQKFGDAPIADKMREARLRWYGHVLREKEDGVRKIGLNIEVLYLEKWKSGHKAATAARNINGAFGEHFAKEAQFAIDLKEMKFPKMKTPSLHKDDHLKAIMEESNCERASTAFRH